jgi:predicted outer membrane protein
MATSLPKAAMRPQMRAPGLQVATGLPIRLSASGAAGSHRMHIRHLHMFHPRQLLALASFTLCTTLPLSAQVEPPMRPEPRLPRQVVEQPLRRQQVTNGDAALATWLQVESNNEVAFARFALGKTQNAEVKAFAEQMVVDREAFQKALRPFLDTEVTDSSIPGGKPPGENARDADSVDNGRRARPRTASGVREAVPMAPFDYTALIRDLGMKRQETAIKALDEKTGVEFDQCFLRMQVAGHKDATGAFQVFRSYSSERLTPVLARGEEIAAAHLERAEALCQQVETLGKKVEPAPK